MFGMIKRSSVDFGSALVLMTWSDIDRKYLKWLYRLKLLKRPCKELERVEFSCIGFDSYQHSLIRVGGV